MVDSGDTEPPAEDKTESLDEIIERARDLAARGELLRAIELLGTVEDARDPRVFLTMASIYGRVREFERATAYLDRALELDDGSYEAWMNKGTYLAALGRAEEALPCFDRAIEIQPDRWESWLHKGVLLHEMRRVDEAIEALDEGLRIAPDSPVLHYRRGMALSDRRDLLEAVRAFESALRHEPGLLMAWLEKGLILYEMQRFEDAIHCFERVLSTADSPHANAYRGICLYHLDRHDEARSALLAAQELCPPDQTLLKAIVASMLRRLDDGEGATDGGGHPAPPSADGGDEGREGWGSARVGRRGDDRDKPEDMGEPRGRGSGGGVAKERRWDIQYV